MRFFLFTLICFISSTLAAQDIFVATNGNDNTGDGRMNNPYRTINFAADQAFPGSTIQIRGGTYRNSQFNDGDIWEGDNVANLSLNGTANEYITIQPYNDEDVVIEFDATYGFILRNSSYVRVKGLTFKGISDQITLTEAENAWGLYKDASGTLHDLQQEMGIDISDPTLIGTQRDKPATPNADKPSYYNGRALVANSSHHIEFIDNIVRDVPSAAIRAQQSDYILISGNKVYGNTFYTTQGVGAITVAEATVPNGDASNEIKIIIEKNEVYGNENRLISWNPNKSFVKFEIDEGTGIFLTRNNDTYANGRMLIANNLSYQNGASGIVCHFTDNAIIAHNTVYDNATTNTGDAGGIGVNNSDTVTIINNITWSKSDKWALGILANPVTNLTVSNNIIFNDQGQENASRNISNGWVEENPLFMEASNFDFELESDSPAVDAGSDQPAQTEDFNGNPRNDGFPDIGAFEKSATAGIDGVYSNIIQPYPNPFKEKFNVRIPNSNQKIKLYNQAGQEIEIKTNALQNSTVEIKTSSLPIGIYFLQMGSEMTKMIKI
ncbi:Por secretion system C-terminal sorting domain-containing protein [Nonlabens sp. Hel1_33_55]|uniref:T9SS type A sorting domain-containing protein n=1 Tax=Nonlabens sp. Hel1_33_55 TaxID=1336802 RepID=UPI000875E31A|nr:T9SS type A sorting domain-containing protein [Nonlabens sp. Hel1_33_55]SCX99839.1 Por secretion system C-terminal sorting domain-containing protein [Nonlabens sp. Hel1_33_55]